MPRLRINTAGFAIRSIDLKPGSNRLGRAASNDLQIDHPSISSSHCEVVLENGLIRLRDLGSTNGIYYKGQRVGEVTMGHSETFRLGTIDLMFEAESASISNQIAFEKPSLCGQHPRISATAKCPKCERFLCDFCVTTRVVAGEVKKFCRTCRNECAFVNLRFSIPQPDDQRALALLANALRYPLQRHGWVLLLGGSLLLFLIDVVVAGLSMGTPASPSAGVQHSAAKIVALRIGRLRFKHPHSMVGVDAVIRRIIDEPLAV